MRFSTLASVALAAVPLTVADFHYGKSSWIITTATGVYWDILPASQATCYDAYHFTPVGVQSWTAPTTPLTVDICNTTITLDPVSGAWYTGNDGAAPDASGVCDSLNDGEGVVSDSCDIFPYQSRSVFTDYWSCTTEVCDGF